MKPLMGQAQSQLNLDDLFTSSKLVSGNFSRPQPDISQTSELRGKKPSFSEVLLKNLDRKTETKNSTADSPSLGSKIGKTTHHPKEVVTSPRAERRPTAPAQTSSRTHTDKTSLEKSVVKPQSKSARHEEYAQSEINQENPHSRTVETPDHKPDHKNVGQTITGSINENSKAGKLEASLIPLQKQFGKKLTTDSVVNNNAILAFITGRLDKLQVETLPTILNESPLIQKVLGAENINDFLKAPVSINDLANLLELDQNLMAGAARDGLNPSDFVAPREFIRALGVDPLQVETELQTLKQTLPTEGVNAYLERAQTLATADVSDISIPKQHDKITKTTTNLSDDVLARMINSPEDQSLDEKNTDSLPVFSPGYATIQSNSNLNSLAGNFDLFNEHGAPNSDLVAGSTSNIGIDLASPRSVIKNQPVADGQESFSALENFDNIPVTADRELPNNDLLEAFRSGVNPIKSGLRTEAMVASLPNANQSYQTSNTEPLPPEVTIDGKLELITTNTYPFSEMSKEIDETTSTSELELITTNTYPFSEMSKEIDETTSTGELELITTNTDPFSEMSKEIDETTSTKIEFAGNGMSNRSLEEMLIDRNTSAKIQSEQSSRTDKLPLESSDLISDLSELQQHDHMGNEIFSNLEADQVLSRVSERVIDPTTNLAGQSFGDGADSNAFEGGRENTQPTFVSEKFGISRDTKVTFAQKITTPTGENPSSSLTQKIMGQAEMMFRNGGGSMRMNIETPDIGKVDVAIKLNNNQLDVRIITPSDQARDIITREIAGLREGLSQQGLNLRGLEVGKAGESSSRDFAGQGNQQFGQGAQDQKATYNDMKEYVQSFRNSYAPRINDRLGMGAPTVEQWSNQVARYGSKLEVRV